MKETFNDQLEKRMQGLRQGDLCYYTWLCAVRALPFLGADGNFDYWNHQDERQKHLLAIFYALDSVILLESDAIKDIVDAVGNASKTSQANTVANFAVVAAMSAAQSKAKLETASLWGSVAAISTHGAAEKSYIDFKPVLLDDLEVIKSRLPGSVLNNVLKKLNLLNKGKSVFYHDISIYGDIWEQFQNALRDMDCGYWGDWYARLFQKGFSLDENDYMEMEMRLDAPIEIKEQGAAGVAQYMLEKNQGIFNQEGMMNLSQHIQKYTRLPVVLASMAAIPSCTPQQEASEESVKFSRMLKPMIKHAIRVAYDEDFNGEVPVGRSKIGGKPDLPPGFEWFYYKGETDDGEEPKNRPLSFLAQINCSEASKYDKNSLLPKKGMLYFFYELETQAWGFDPKDKGSAKVYYYPGEVKGLIRTDFPSDLSEEFQFPEVPISFLTQKELPDFEEFLAWHEGIENDQWEQYDEAKNKIVGEVEEEKITKLLGYADLVQGSMLLECEEVSNGIYTGDNSVEIPEDDARRYKENCTRWQLLFQMDSIEMKGFDMCWGDMGRIYFYIRKDDLARCDFENCWLIQQCY